MNGFTDPRRVEQLLAETGWLRSLARSLVSAEDRAEDLVQDTLVAVLERPETKRHPEAWLARVLKNLAWRGYRSEHRRRHRETLTARPDLVSTTPADLLERAELQRRIAGAVLALAEPYRSTILLRFFEELSPAEVARRQGVPEATVWTRQRRAIEHLRRRLDREYGDRRAWQSVLLPLWGGKAALTSGAQAGAGGAIAGGGTTSGSTASGSTGAGSTGAGLTGAGSTGAGSTTAGSTSAGSTALGAATGTSATGAAAAGAAATASASSTGLTFAGTLGGIIVMSQKLILTYGLLGAFALAVGVGVGRATKPSGLSPEAVAKDYVGRSRYDEVSARLRELEDQVEKVRVEKDKTSRRAAELESQVAALGKKLAVIDEKEKAAQEESEARAKGKGPAVAFGKWAELDAVKEADWKALATAASAITELIADLVDRQKKGLPIDVDLQQKVAAENNKLVQYAAQIMGKIPTNSPINGEFSHPITMANLMASALENAGLGLTDEQKAEIQRLGGDYDKDYEELQAKYNESTPKLGKLIDEMALKCDWTKEAHGLLTDEQKGAVIHPAVQDRVQLDVFGPGTMATLIAQPAFVGSKEDVRGKIQGFVGEAYGQEFKDNEQFSAIIDNWLKDLEPLLEKPVDPNDGLSVGAAITAGRAQAKAIEELLKLPGLSDKARSVLLSSPGWIVPLLSKKAE